MSNNQMIFHFFSNLKHQPSTSGCSRRGKLPNIFITHHKELMRYKLYNNNIAMVNYRKLVSGWWNGLSEMKSKMGDQKSQSTVNIDGINIIKINVLIQQRIQPEM